MAAAVTFDVAALAGVERLRQGIATAQDNDKWGGLQELLQLPHLELIDPLKVFHGLMTIFSDPANEWMDGGVKLSIAEMFVRLSHACFNVSGREGYLIKQETKNWFEDSLQNSLHNVDEKKRPENGLRYRLECSLSGVLSLYSTDLGSLLHAQSSQVLTVLAEVAKRVAVGDGGGIDLVGIASTVMGDPEGFKAIVKAIFAIGDFARKEYQKRWYLGIIEVEGLVAVSLATGGAGGASSVAEATEAWERLKQVLQASKIANWHIVYAGVCALEKIVSCESSPFRSEAWEILKSYSTFKGLGRLSKDNWRIREKVLEVCIILQKSLASSTTTPSRKIRDEAQNILLKRGVAEKNPRVHILLKNQDNIVTVREAWRQSWPRQKGDVEEALDAQKKQLESLEEQIKRGMVRQPELDERFERLQAAMTGQLTRLEEIGAQIGTKMEIVDRMRRQLDGIAKAVCFLQVILGEVRHDIQDVQKSVKLVMDFLKIQAQIQAHDDQGLILQRSRPSDVLNDLKIAFSELSRGKKRGEGAFGVVYEGTFRQQRVAIKKLKLNAMTDQALEELEHEARVMRELNSSNILPLLAVVLDPPCLVTPLMERGSLYDFIGSGKWKSGFPWKTRLQIALDVALGLTALHVRKIIHHDIKSQNVLLDEKMRAKICDFGVAKMRNDSTLQQTEEIGEGRGSAEGAKGTLCWCAPEVLEIPPAYSRMNDIYSFGMVLWELAALKPPYHGSSELLISDEVKKGKREEIPDNCPEPFASLISMCWQQDMKSRPDAITVVAELRKLLLSPRLPTWQDGGGGWKDGSPQFFQLLSAAEGRTEIQQQAEMQQITDSDVVSSVLDLLTRMGIAAPDDDLPFEEFASQVDDKDSIWLEALSMIESKSGLAKLLVDGLCDPSASNNRKSACSLGISAIAHCNVEFVYTMKSEHGDSLRRGLVWLLENGDGVGKNRAAGAISQVAVLSTSFVENIESEHGDSLRRGLVWLLENGDKNGKNNAAAAIMNVARGSLPFALKLIQQHRSQLIKGFQKMDKFSRFLRNAVWELQQIDPTFSI